MKPHNIDSYKNKYSTISFDRTDDGILTMKFHGPKGPDDPFVYRGALAFEHPNTEWSHAFYDVARDYDNEVLIFTTVGPDYISEAATDFRGNCELVGKEAAVNPLDFDFGMSNNKWTHFSALSIECPMISVVKGEAVTHAELALHADIVICSDDAVFQDMPHFDSGLYVPGDGSHVAWPLAIGTNRARNFLITGQRIPADEALRLGVVSEVLPKDQLDQRAIEIAREFLRRPKLVRRYTRVLNTQRARELLVQFHGFGLALEGLACAGRVVDEGVVATETPFKLGTDELA